MSEISTSISSTPAAPPPVIDPKVKVDTGRVMKTEVPVPFTEYRNEHKTPFVAKYIDAPLTWDQQDMVEDVTVVEDYLKNLVNIGDLENTTKSAETKLIKLEKMAGIDKIENKAQRIGKLAEFVVYLTKLEKRAHGYAQN